MKKECTECIWYNKHYCTSTSKIKPAPECMFNAAIYKATESYFYKEYNIDTSAEHPAMDDDIVRTIEKSIESRNKDA